MKWLRFSGLLCIVRKTEAVKDGSIPTLRAAVGEESCDTEISYWDTSHEECVCDTGYRHPSSDEKTKCEAYDICQSENRCDVQRSTCRTVEDADRKRRLTCDCWDGYEHTDDDIICTVIDQCHTPEERCKGIEFDGCEPIVRGYRCRCSFGYKAADENEHECVNINECVEGLNATGIPVCNPISGQCHDLTDGQAYQCRCYQGWMSDWSMEALKEGCKDCCVDIDECARNISSCEQICEQGVFNDGVTNFTCACRNAFYLQDDGMHCEECGYGEWQPWSECSVPCGQGTQQQLRYLEDGIGQSTCAPYQSQQRDCFLEDCGDANCAYTPWGVWSECSATCGGGVRTKTRLPTRANAKCLDTSLTEVCNPQKCATVTDAVKSVGITAWLFIAVTFFCCLAGGGALFKLFCWRRRVQNEESAETLS